MSLVHPADDIAAVRHALASGDARARSSAAEFLDNILRGDGRHRVMLLVEDMPLAERVRKGNNLFRTRQRDVEDTLAQLIHDESQEVAATAIQVVESRRMWSLAGDLEHVLEHRSAKDWSVFEAASWASAAQRMPADRRRVLWQEPLPAVELADRLRRIRLFDFVSVDELFRVASLGRQVRHETGRVLSQEGQPADTLHFVLDGKVALKSARGQRGRGLGPRRHQLRGGARGPPGAQHGDRARADHHAVDDHRGVPAPGLRERRDRPGHLPACCSRRDARRRGARSCTASSRPNSSGASPTASRRSTASSCCRPARCCSAPRRPNWCGWRRSPVSCRSPPGTSLFKPGDDAAIHAVLTGQVEVIADGAAPEVADSGDVVGIYEALSGRFMTSQGKVVTAGNTLRIDPGELFELMADNIPLLQGLFSGLLHASSTPPREAAAAHPVAG